MSPADGAVLIGGVISWGLTFYLCGFFIGTLYRIVDEG
jgi:hypothetical protein